MLTTLTIRNVPDSLARKLKLRAERNHRSLQGEVLAILEQAALGSAVEQPAKAYRSSAGTDGPAVVQRTVSAPLDPTHGKKMTIEELWERGKRLGIATPDESVLIVRKLRDGRRSR